MTSVGIDKGALQISLRDSRIVVFQLRKGCAYRDVVPVRHGLFRNGSSLAREPDGGPGEVDGEDNDREHHVLRHLCDSSVICNNVHPALIAMKRSVATQGHFVSIR